MNGLQDLISKLQKIEEAPEPAAPTTTDRVKPTPVAPAPAADPQRAAYDQFKADDAKKAAIETVKKYMSKPVNQIGRLENLIDPATGFIYYGQAGMDATQGTPTKMPMKFMSQGDQASMMNAITTAGLKVVDSGGYAMIDPASLKTLGQAPAATTAPTGSDQKPAPTADANKAAMVKRFTELLTKAGVITAPAAAPTPGNTDISKGAVDYNLAPQTASGPGIKLPTAPLKESITFKSSIGQILAEAGALDKIDTDRLTKAPVGGISDIAAKPAAPAKAPAAPAAPALSKEEYSELSKLYGELSVTYKDDTTLAPLFTAYNKVPPTWSSAPAAAPAATPTAPTKNLAPVDPKIKQFQDEVKKLDPTAFPKYGADGRMGTETQTEIGKHPDIANKYGLKSSKEAPAGVTDKHMGSSDKAAPAAIAGNPIKPPAELAKAIPSPKAGDMYWVNGNRYEFKPPRASTGPHGAPASPGGWTHVYGNLNPATLGGFTRGWVATNGSNQYTGPDGPQTAKQAPPATPAPQVQAESTGFSNDELTRLVSLIHHR